MVVLPAFKGCDVRCVLSVQPAGAGKGAAGDEDDDEDDEEEAEVAVEEYEDDEDDDDEEDGDEVRALAISKAPSPNFRHDPESLSRCICSLVIFNPAGIEGSSDGAGGGGCWDCLSSGTGSESLRACPPMCHATCAVLPSHV